MKNKSVTITIIANMTSNYGEGLGNIASVQKVYKNGKEYATRSRESLKNAICVQAGLYGDLQTVRSTASSSEKSPTQKLVTADVNAATCKALEGGYMSTIDTTYIRNSSFYLTDAVAVAPFVNDARFHNNLYLATNYAQAKNLNVQSKDKNVGLMPYQYEFDKSMKVYSITIDLEEIGIDKNFNAEASPEEKCQRVCDILDSVQYLSLVVKGNLDNAEPIFAVGGMSPRKTHAFENAVNVKGTKLVTEPVKEKLKDGFKCAMLRSGQLANEDDIVRELNPISVAEFFEDIKKQVKEYYLG